MERESEITIGIKRLLNTAPFETLEIRLETTEKITWETQQQRSDKIDNWTKVTAAKYIDTQKTILKELGVEEKRGWYKSKPSEENSK